MSYLTVQLKATRLRHYATTTTRQLSSLHQNDDLSLAKSESYQLLQKSSVKTDYFQKSLPRLPIPKLDKTCERYLATQKALLDDQEFKTTEALVASFRDGEGAALDSRLRAKDKLNKNTSYISGPWSDMYLCDRRSVCFNHNPGIALADDPRPGFSDPAIRASNLLISVLRFYRSYVRDILYPDVYHMTPAKTNNPEFWKNRVRFFPTAFATQLSYLFMAFPLDMSQFPNLLQSTRIPMKNRDIIKRYPDSRHVVVLRKGRFYSFDVLDKNGDIFPPSYYLSCLRNIIKDAGNKEAVGIGALTSEDRDEWTEAREHLLSLEGNKAKLSVVDSAMFTMCLDDWNHSDETTTETVKNLVCGPDVTNRWFDKSFSLVFTANGLAGINFEHSWGDGVAVMRLIDEMVTDSNKNAFVTPDTVTNDTVGHESVTGFDFTSDARIRDTVESAKRKFTNRLSEVAFDAFKFEKFGKKACKSANVGPDSVMQLAFQIAYHKLTGTFVPTYESCSTAIFRHGRTETLRPGTLETRACAEAFNSRNARSDAELLSLMQKCSKTHQTLTKSAAQGQGWDRHLFALRTLAASEPGTQYGIFTDPAYARINQNILSTSTLSSVNMGAGGFCAVVRNGFGLGYQIRNNDLGVCTSSYVGHASGADMTSALQSTFEQIDKVIKSQK